MPEVTGGLHGFKVAAPPRPPSLEDIEKLQQKALAFNKENFQLAQGYTQVLIALGFVAFLTIWAKMAPAMPYMSVLVSGALLGLSLIVFIAFHLLQMLLRSLPGLKLAKELQKTDSVEDQLVAFADYDRRQIKNLAPILFIWPSVFIFCVVTGLGSAAFVVIQAFWSVVISAG